MRKLELQSVRSMFALERKEVLSPKGPSGVNTREGKRWTCQSRGECAEMDLLFTSDVVRPPRSFT